MTIPDPVELVIALLLADPGVAALVAGRVGREIPEGDGPLMPRACVTVTPAGGPGRKADVNRRVNRLDTACYGATLTESWGVHQAVRETLETFVRDGGDLISVVTSSDGVNGRLPDTQWPVAYASYLVRTAA